MLRKYHKRIFVWTAGNIFGFAHRILSGPVGRIELPAPCLPCTRSTTELHPESRLRCSQRRYLVSERDAFNEV